MLVFAALPTVDPAQPRAPTLQAAEARADNLSFILGEHLRKRVAAAAASPRQPTADTAAGPVRGQSDGVGGGATFRVRLASKSVH